MNQMQFFALPYAGGSMSIYMDWKKIMPQCIEVLPIEYNGHGSRFVKELYRTPEVAIDDISLRLEEKITKDYILFGHSLGSILAYKVVEKRMKAKLKLPKLLILGGTRPPHLLYKDKKYSHLQKDEFMNEFFRWGQIPKELMEDKEMYDMYYEILHTDIVLNESLRYDSEHTILNVPIVVFTGSEDVEAPKDDMLEWRQYTNGDFKLFEIKGDHFFPFQKENNFFPLLLDLLEETAE